MEPAGRASEEPRGERWGRGTRDGGGGGRDTGPRLLAAGPENERQLQGLLPQDAVGEELSPEASGAPPGSDAGQRSQPPSSGARQCPPAHRDRAVELVGSQSRGTGRSLQGRETKPSRRQASPTPGQQKRSKVRDLAVAGSSCGPSSGPAPHHPVPCGLGRGSCHLGNLLNTLAPDSPDSGRKKGPPEVSCQVRKKTRTLYRSDQLEELEKAFQEDHYPDSDKRREIAHSVGVAPQRIMVWFQNRRAKWRRVEKVNGKGDRASPEAPAPTGGQGSSTDAQPPPEGSLGPGSGTSSQELLHDARPESPVQLDPNRLPDPTLPCEAAHWMALTPPLFSPPPVRRASLPFPLGPVQAPQLMPLLLDAPGSDGCLREGPCGSWGTSITPPPSCPYLEELEPQDHQPSYQQGSFPFPPASQPLFSYLHPFSFPTPSTLTPPPLEDILFPGPYGPHRGPAQGYFPGPPSGQVLLQPSTRTMGPMPWSHPCPPEQPLPSPFCTQALGHPSGAEGFFSDDLFPAPYDQTVNGQPSPGPSGARPSGMGPLTVPQDQAATRDEARAGPLLDIILGIP
ncbi:PREDICTED: homeobox protein NOBOX [Chrysochloris asiatica]|uniref:Homeobox protein NOBOX n=1 Tax=Chrysochloris asiatica TaxID=185453 RepID=A0A9B0TJ32_CHRAS|nr:PREDICTED: homeobox protein NOBOX [Chrysochloris asiatica]